MYVVESGPENPIYGPENMSKHEKFIASNPEVMIYNGNLEKDGFYLLKKPDDDSWQEGDKIEVCGAELFPGALLSAADSVHKVEIAYMVMKYSGVMYAQKVAMKPFDGDDPDNPTDSPETEYHATMKAKGRGFDVLEPIAMAKFGNVRYLYTKYRNNVWTLDNISYTIHPEDPAYEKTIKPALELMTNTLAELHARGIAHGDPQPKNFMIDDEGEVPVPDLEMATIAESTEEHIEMLVGDDGDIVRSPFFKDVLLLWYALTRDREEDGYQNVFLKGVSKKVYMRVFEEFTDMYLDSLDAHLDPELAIHFKPEEFKEDLLTHYLVGVQ